MVLDNGRFLTSELANVTQMLDEHFRAAFSAAKMVSSAVLQWMENGEVLGEDDLSKVTHLEEKGNELKRAILSELARANTLLQREDLLRLVHYNDKLIDASEIACYHLAAFMGSWKPEGTLKEKIVELGEKYLEIVTHQRKAIRFLSLDMEKALAKTYEICNVEKTIDVLMRDIWALLYPMKLPIEIILRVRDFVNALEEGSNFAEDASNTIRGLSLTLNT
ncbi:MAG: DUF47 family protein [Candidatus Thorarchaeota archaeon]|nr:DUF47 family protein [Candidatus Thorarchaeota archaeon]